MCIRDRLLPLREGQPRVPRVGDAPPVHAVVDERRGRLAQDCRLRREGDPRHRGESARTDRAGARARGRGRRRRNGPAADAAARGRPEEARLELQE
eukprot:7561396-Alexandrium_andersonii.AAC.1